MNKLKRVLILRNIDLTTAPFKDSENSIFLFCLSPLSFSPSYFHSHQQREIRKNKTAIHFHTNILANISLLAKRGAPVPVVKILNTFHLPSPLKS